MTANAQGLNNKGMENAPQTNPPDSKKSGKGGWLSYILLPGIIPQIKELGRGGFGYFAFLIATVYQAVRILPAGHPYTQYENLGTFGIRHVVAAAANNVKLNKKNLDQIIIFFAVLAGIIILALQVIAFALLMFSGEAWAQPNPTPDSFGGIFNTPAENQSTDIAFHMMREVFGIPDLFGAIEGGPTAFHQGLQAMFQFYNLAILVVAVLVFIYYVIVVVAETAQTGTPFGKRFSHIYAPFRLVIAIGLLVPLNYGFNGSQYITLFAAKLGSGFATTGWTQFNDAITQKNPLGAENATLISDTEPPDIEGLVGFMGVAVTCKEAYALKNITIEGKIAFKKPDDTTEFLPLEEGAYDTLAAANNNADIAVHFGKFEGPAGQHFTSYCGKATVPIVVPMSQELTGTGLDSNGEIEAQNETQGTDSGNPGFLQKEYLKLIISLWENSELQTLGKTFSQIHDPGTRCNNLGDCRPLSEKRETIIGTARSSLETLVIQHYEDAREQADFTIREQTKKRGWGGAGIWYNRIAQINGAYVVATMSPPEGKSYPLVMEDVHTQKKNQDAKYKTCKAYEPNLADNDDTELRLGELDQYFAAVLNDSYQYWVCHQETRAANFFIDAAVAIFGLNGLVNIRGELDDEGNPVGAQIHPLAKLSALGRGLVESAIRNMALAITSSAVGGVLGVLEPQLGQAAGAASQMFVSIATIGLSVGFITYYILPFLPFIYFFFAVGGWVKSIFEAMVGAPLWALAHLRIDGDGLPGKMAMNGYVLILEIFLRPILTVFGLLGGMAIFTALATILNEIFTLVVANTANVDLTKDDARGIIDVFFFTVMYAVILYMMATSSFKMINLVPNNILRWLGQSVSAFSDNSADPTQGLIQYAALGGARIGGQLGTGLTKLGQAGGETVGGFLQASRAGQNTQN